LDKLKNFGKKLFEDKERAQQQQLVLDNLEDNLTVIIRKFETAKYNLNSTQNGYLSKETTPLLPHPKNITSNSEERRIYEEFFKSVYNAVRSAYYTYRKLEVVEPTDQLSDIGLMLQKHAYRLEDLERRMKSVEVPSSCCIII
jgi:hypothetical protein